MGASISSTSSTSVTLADLLSTRFAPIQDAIMASLGPLERIALMLTSKTINKNINEKLLSGTFNIDVTLQPFFRNTKAFRSLQARCNALIGGPFAYCLFAGLPRFDCIYLYVGQEVDAMTRYLEAENYVRDETNAEAPIRYRDGEVLSEDVYEKDGPGGRKLKVVITKCQTQSLAHMVLQDAYATGMLTFITWNKAYHLLPHTTFVRREMFLLRNIKEMDPYELRLFSLRGMKIKSVHWNAHDEIRPTDCQLLTRLRRVGDQHTWVMPLNTEGVTPSTVPDAVLEASTFRLDLPDRNDHKTLFYEMNMCTELRHPVLRHTYSTTRFDAGIETPYYEKLSKLYDRLSEATAIELTKMDEDERPKEYDRLVNGSAIACDMEEFVRPDDWCYFDEDVRAFLMAAWKEQVRLEEEEEEEEELLLDHRSAKRARRS
ncbi:uncharacterized protein J4E88_007241 [Alternaria novae-zelandiae]|uniref:uncharacterized protein n=1 Tax=Alternaria novae-zelandiae TaxID=430562 RepID=UPI0020C36BA1|nr:uncharacterized protein J4E88_007241 [Alternaria novae-zelandiae]KAI4676327.1 hypothetical protein J4E88_007241 [Alternaria novae-zelandiae]